MNEQEILDAVRGLAKSQGFYGRLLETLQENPNTLKYLAAHKFHDTTDLVLYLESSI